LASAFKSGPGLSNSALALECNRFDIHLWVAAKEVVLVEGGLGAMKKARKGRFDDKCLAEKKK
jgi:hypothetical protein